ncbi:MAG: signal peptidase I [Clostridia bacterium]|nr:signal peptidase I [Clostridia bacterium]
MNKDKRVLYAVSFTIFAALLWLLFVPMKSSRITTAILLLPIAALTRLLIRKRTSPSVHKREVLLVVSLVGILFVVLLHMSGLYFGYYRNPYFVNTAVLLKYILPLTAIIGATELIRATILAQKSKLASFLCFLSCVLIETLAVSSIARITSINRFMDVVGLALLPAISANISYHYLSKNFGMLPNIAFRWITTMYAYLLPTLPSMSDALLSCIEILLPIFLMALILAMYEKKKKFARHKETALGRVTVVITTVIIVAMAMLISCQFRFGAIVIATESMTGELNKGDMIIYERYDDQPILEGQIIVFLDDKSKIVHRVVKIDRVGGETRYYTKGDANTTLDVGYRTEEDIFGLTDVKVAYVGYPTLWLREMLKPRP